MLNRVAIRHRYPAEIRGDCDLGSHESPDDKSPISAGVSKSTAGRLGLVTMFCLSTAYGKFCLGRKEFEALPEQIGCS